MHAFVFAWEQDAEDSSDEEWIQYERNFRTNLAEFGGVHGVPNPTPYPVVVPLDVDIEMSQLIADAFRRRDISARGEERDFEHGDDNTSGSNYAPRAQAGEEDDLSDNCSDSIVEDCDAGEEFAHEGPGNEDAA